jgi:hypothetical protein
MRLYHFTTTDHGLAALRDSRLKLARIAQLNDPFEFSGAVMTKGVRRYANHWKEYLNQRMGLLCFSETWSEPLLWAHYAKSHEGMCLGFDIDFSGLEKVNYLQQRPTAEELGLVDPETLMTNDDIFNFPIPYRKLMSLKFSAWGYEREWRLFCDLEHFDPVSQLHFERFGSTMILREVIVGNRSNLAPDRLALVLKNHAGVTVRRARPAHRTFDVVEHMGAHKWRRISTAHTT